MNYKRTAYRNVGCVRRREAARCDTPDAERIPVCDSCKYDGERSLAAVYPIKQCWKDIVDGCEGFSRGTIFCELYKPFMGDKCQRGGCGK